MKPVGAGAGEGEGEGPGAGEGAGDGWDIEAGATTARLQLSNAMQNSVFR